MTLRFPLLALALLAASQLPGAQGQDVAEAIVVADDPVGDHGDPSGRSTALDLRSLAVAEGALEFQIRIAVAGLDPPAKVPLAEAVVYEVFFGFAGVSYQVRAVRDGNLAGPVQATLLWDRSGGHEYELAAELEASVDPAGQAVVVTLPRTVLLDAAGAPAFAGQRLSGFWVQASGVVTAMEPAPQDRAPDLGESTAVVEVKYGVQQQGTARLSSRQQFRSSNGEPATFRYLLDAENLAGREDRFLFEVGRVPAGWQVAVPDGPVAIGAQGHRDIEVLADVPFAHQHGRLETFAVTMTSLTDGASVGRILLGILYTEPAQPAGHHDTLTLHSRVGPGLTLAMATALGSAGGGVDAYMNTLTEDPADAGVEVPPHYDGVAAADAAATFTWMVPLRPGLALGLDFDLARTGEARIPFTLPAPVVGATLTGAVRLLGNVTPDPGAGVALAQLVAAAPVDGLGGQVVLQAAVQPLPAGEYVPFHPDNDLWLELVLTYGRPDAATGPATPKLVPGGTLQMPLVEYRDAAGLPLSEAAEAGAGGDDAPAGRAGASTAAEGGSGQPEAKDTPGLPLLAVVLLLVLLGRLRKGP